MPKIPYHCPRCGYETIQKNSMRIHLLQKKSACPTLESTLELTEEIKQYVLANRIFKPPTEHRPRPIPTQTQTQIEKLQLQIDFLKTKRNESFYQAIVEEHLQGTHKRLEYCITDVSTDRVHAEIKNWDCFTQAIGQLNFYNKLDPKEELHIYLFGKAPRHNDRIISHLIEMGFLVHTFRDVEDGVVIHQYNANLENTEVFHKVITSV
jgi:hypothetical protein